MDIEKLLATRNSSIRDAIKIMDAGGIGIVFIVDLEKNVIGLITDGDFRRAILNGVRLSQNILTITNTKFTSLNKDSSNKQIINLFLDKRIERIPVLHNKKLIDVLLREDYDLHGKIILPDKVFDFPVVIMAGGKGTRMKPFTNIFPKPLLPIGERAMLEVIMDEYIKYGFKKFYVTINYKANLIKAYFDDLGDKYDISYIEESKFLGTAGALKLLHLKKQTPVFVSNCDILIRDNYLNILEFHKAGRYDMTIVAAMIYQKVPYGVCKIKNGGELEQLSEKPEFDYLVNSGMYVLNSHILDLIPHNEFFHMTQLMEVLRNQGGKVGVYPVSEKSWIDVGQWEGYSKMDGF